MLLGGEGRLFYANIDWQVRDALIADLARSHWPFVYVGHGAPLLLRFPLGMYLLPALAAKLGGQPAADAMLAVQNGAVLGLVLALGSLLGADARRRRLLLVVVLGFGGLDLFGAALLRPDRLLPLSSNLESWGPTIFMSNMGSAFWTPHHALAAWIGTVLFLLWRCGQVPLALFLAPLPLVAIWSPLGLMGVMPFAALAGIETLVRRRLRPADLVLPALALALAVLPLRYLGADTTSVGFGVDPIPAPAWLLFEAIEVLPFLGCALLAARTGRLGMSTVAVATTCLLLFPFLTIGESVDFTMRAGAPAIAILSVLCADALADGAGRARAALIVLLILGAATPAHDVLRALAYRPAPPPRCDYWKAWDQSFWYQGKETYLARLPLMPASLRPGHPATVAPLEPAACWSRPWTVPRWPAAARWLGA